MLNGQIYRVDGSEGAEVLVTDRVSASAANRLDPLLVRQRGNDDGVLEARLHRLGLFG